VYDPAGVVRVHSGIVDMHVRREAIAPARVAAPFPEIANQTYGRYAVRFRADPVPGFKLAWLLWPVSERWPQDGEINFPEGDLDGGINAFMHRLGATDGGDQDVYGTDGASFAHWHTAVIEWRPGRVRFVFDGRVIGESTRRVPNTAMRWVLQTETSLDAAPAIGAGGHVQVDWVTVHRAV
jgi:beta-glucanase (GH16 family)